LPDDLYKLGVTKVDYAALGLGHLAEMEGEAESVESEEEL
jgi:hypothetical protein